MLCGAKHGTGGIQSCFMQIYDDDSNTDDEHFDYCYCELLKSGLHDKFKLQSITVFSELVLLFICLFVF